MPVPDMFRIKICGLTDFENAIAVRQACATADKERSETAADGAVEDRPSLPGNVAGLVRFIGLRSINVIHNPVRM